MAGAAAAGGVRAWSVFGTIGVRGLGGAISQLVGFNRAGKATAAIAKTITGTFATLAKVAGTVTLAIGGIAAISTKSFASFDQAMTRSLAIMSDVSESMRQDMVASARRIGRQTEFSATQAAEAYFFLASAGLDAKQSVAALPAVTQFATAGQFDLAQATDLLTDAQSALGLASDDATEHLENMTRVSDTLVKANTLANASVEQFSQALTNKLAGRMRAMNVPLEEGVALLAAFADQGIKGKRAGQQLTIVLRDLPKAALDNAEAFEELGVQVFDASGELRPMHQIIGDLERALGDMSTQERIAALETTGLQKRAADALNILLGTSEATEEWTESLADAAGMADEVARKQRSSWMMAWTRFTSAIEDAKIALGAEFAPVFRAIAEDITEWIGRQDFAQLARQIKSATETIVTTVVQGLGKIGLAVMRLVNGAMSLGRALRDNPIAQLLGIEGTDRGRIEELRQKIENIDNLIRDVQQGASRANLGPRLAALGLPPDADVEGLRRYRQALESEFDMVARKIAETEGKMQRVRGVFEGMAEFELNLPDAIGAGSGAIGGGGDGDGGDGLDVGTDNLPSVKIPVTAEVTGEKVDVSPLSEEIKEGFVKVENDLGPDLGQAGARLGQSLIQGIVRGSFELEDFLKSAFSALMNALLFGSGGVFAALGISSPAASTVPIGEAMVLGVVKGLHRTTPLLRSAMHRAFTPSISPGRAVRLAGAGGTGALNRVPQGAGVTPDHSGLINLDFSNFPEARTPMGRERDQQWQQWLRNQSDIAKEDGYSFEGRR